MSADLYSVLGIAPTLAPSDVKRGYFAALKRHPPHADPEGFRRIRDAYERLSSGEALIAAYMASPPDISAVLAELEATIGAEIARVAETHALGQRDAAAKTALLDTLSRLQLADILAAWGA
jgi:hypothetical protein